MKKKLAYFVSGEGRLALYCMNFIKECMNNEAETTLIIYSDECNAIKNISYLNIKSYIIKDNWKLNREKICNYICDLCLENNIDFIAMTFCKLLCGKIINIYNNKIINLHPSILPSFKGMNAVKKALNYNSRFIGATTHFIDKNLDEGIILCQGIIPVEQNADINIVKNNQYLLLKKLYLNTLWFYITDSIEIVNNKSFIKNSYSNSLEINPKAKTSIIQNFIENNI